VHRRLRRKKPASVPGEPDTLKLCPVFRRLDSLIGTINSQREFDQSVMLGRTIRRSGTEEPKKMYTSIMSARIPDAASWFQVRVSQRPPKNSSPLYVPFYRFLRIGYIYAASEIGRTVPCSLRKWIIALNLPLTPFSQRFVQHQNYAPVLPEYPPFCSQRTRTKIMSL